MEIHEPCRLGYKTEEDNKQNFAILSFLATFNNFTFISESLSLSKNFVGKQAKLGNMTGLALIGLFTSYAFRFQFGFNY
ncbi:hypothetical protein HanIR_Chr07g0329151 [Helianthus annuus]|nr:hypothetical protein HanIR_Chr07g0329151 [Helianthus annuus]